MKKQLLSEDMMASGRLSASTSPAAPHQIFDFPATSINGTKTGVGFSEILM